jgi:hypothetical protein
MEPAQGGTATNPLSFGILTQFYTERIAYLLSFSNICHHLLPTVSTRCSKVFASLQALHILA